MTSNDSNIRTSFRNLDAPVEVDPAFAERIHTAIASEISPPALQAMAQPSTPNTQNPIPKTEPRFRWQDIAAAAVLLLALTGLITGAIRLLSTNESGPIILVDANTPQNTTTGNTTSESTSSVMSGGTAAQDLQYAGPAPATGHVKPAWSIDPSGLFTRPPYLFDGVLYGIHDEWSADHPFLGTVFAIDAETGDRIWEQTINPTWLLAVSEQGVLVTVPDPETRAGREAAEVPGPVRISLLDRATGTPIWQSAHRYGELPQLLNLPLVIAGNTIWFTDGKSHIYAIDMTDGTERWQLEFNPACRELGPEADECLYRSTTFVRFAVGPETVYLADTAIGELIALAAETGEEIWRVDLEDRAGTRTTISALVAVEGGVAIHLMEPLAPDPADVHYTSVWSETDGAERWSSEATIYEVASDGERLFVTADPDGNECCDLVALDVATGRELGRTATGFTMVVGYLAEQNTVLLYKMPTDDLKPSPLGYIGIDLDTWALVWNFDSSEDPCLLVLPFLDDGGFGCFGESLTVYRPNTAEALPTPVVAPEVAGVPVMPRGSAAQDYRFNGSLPPELEESPAWTIPALDGPSPWKQPLMYGDFLYLFDFEIATQTDTETTFTKPTLQARRASTGEVVWEQPVSLLGPFIVTAQGIVTQEQVGQYYRIVLLDRLTGTRIWESADRFGGPERGTGSGSNQIIVDGETIYMARGDGAIYALDLLTGETAWGYIYPQIAEDGLALRVCTSEDSCTVRSLMATTLAASNGTLYVNDLTTGQIFAMDERGDPVTWSVSMQPFVGSGAFFADGIATPLGYLVRTTVAEGESGFPGEQRLTLVGSESGEVLWSIEMPTTGIMTSDGQFAYLTTPFDEFDCCYVLKVDLETGESTQIAELDNGASILGFLPEENALLLSTYSSPFTTFALTATSGEQIWVFGDGSNQCLPSFPTAADGSLACETERAGVMVYRPVSTEAPADASPTPVVAPEVAGVPVINLTGSAANDGNLPGVMPPLGTTYELLWEDLDRIPENLNVPFALIAGDVVVTTSYLGEAVARTDPFLIVRDLATGEELWRTTLNGQMPVSITPRGVLIGTTMVRTSTSSVGFTLLDLHTGVELWSTEQIYSAESNAISMAKVDGDTVYIMDGETRLVALDLATGAERWAFDGAQGRTQDEMNGECIPTHPECGGRAYLPGAMAIAGDVAWRYLPRTGELFALNIADGSVRWVHNLAERTSIPAPNVRLIGTQFGVIPVVTGSSTAETPYLGFWEAKNGDEIWTKAMSISSAYVHTEILGVTQLDQFNGYSCCLFTGIGITTGQIEGEITVEEMVLAGFYRSSETIALVEQSPIFTGGDRVAHGAFLFTSGEMADVPVPAEQVIPGCAQIAPGTDGEHVVCTRPNGQFALYRAVPIAENVDPLPTPGQTTEGCFDPDDQVTVIEDGVNLRQTPDIDARIERQLEEGAVVMIIAPDAEMDADGNTWCWVRDPETALVGYVMEEFLTPAEP